MGRWAVIAQFGRNEGYVTEVVARVTGTRDDAREALVEAARWYRRPRREKRREVYRLPDGDSHLLVLQGAVTRLEITLTIAELLYASDDGPDAPEGPDTAAWAAGPAGGADGPGRSPEDGRPAQ
ncbi:hypothetical protein [Streptomyces sp. NPDC048659]|uniref:hypothetical protein n=1 Tax=Streptomyces sp. NPDC048659 TaxID=3155489 RepID=UPI0034326F3A